jgi:hypothetical protein
MNLQQHDISVHQSLRHQQYQQPASCASPQRKQSNLQAVVHLVSVRLPAARTQPYCMLLAAYFALLLRKQQGKVLHHTYESNCAGCPTL